MAGNLLVGKFAVFYQTGELGSLRIGESGRPAASIAAIGLIFICHRCDYNPFVYRLLRFCYIIGDVGNIDDSSTFERTPYCAPSNYAMLAAHPHRSAAKTFLIAAALLLAVMFAYAVYGSYRIREAQILRADRAGEIAPK